MKFSALLDRATNKELIEPDWEAVFAVVDAIRSGDAQVRPALLAIQKKCHSENPHVALHGLLALEAVVKNCGEKVHVEVATKEFMEDMKHLAASSNEKVKEKICEILQCWSHAFRDKQEYKIIKDTVQLMKMEGYTFPSLRVSDALFDAESAPDWVEAEQCHRCKVQFSLLTRKHHCRNCGQIFCDRCSSRTSLIPKYGIEKEVRVCESCFDRLKGLTKEETSKKAAETSKETSASKPGSTDAAKPAVNKDGKTEAEIREEEELQLALALSQSEAEEHDRRRKGRGGSFPAYGTRSSSNVGMSSTAASEANNVYKGTAEAPPAAGVDSEDTELARYLNRSYWEQRKGSGGSSASPGAVWNGILRSSPTPSAPTPDKYGPSAIAQSPVTANSGEPNAVGVKADEVFQNGDVNEHSEFTQNLRSSIEIFVNRIKSNQARGRSVVTDSSIQSLFLSLTEMHSDLLKHLQELDEKRSYYESLQDKVVQIREAREAVDALREEHEHKRQQEMQEQQRQRHIQMMHKLEIMRQKKHEYLEHQRLQAIHRMQSQEREINMRKEQQAAQYAAMMQAMQAGAQQQGGPPPPVYMPPTAQQIQPHGQQPHHQGGVMMGGPTHHQPMMYHPAPPMQTGPGGSPGHAPAGNAQPYNMQAVSAALPQSYGPPQYAISPPSYAAPPGYNMPPPGQVYGIPPAPYVSPEQLAAHMGTPQGTAQHLPYVPAQVGPVTNQQTPVNQPRVEAPPPSQGAADVAQLISFD